MPTPTDYPPQQHSYASRTGLLHLSTTTKQDTVMGYEQHKNMLVLGSQLVRNCNKVHGITDAEP